MKSDTIVFHCSLQLLVLFVQFTLCITFAFAFVTLCSAPNLSCCLVSCSTIKYSHSKFHLIQNICDSVVSANVLTALVYINQSINQDICCSSMKMDNCPICSHKVLQHAKSIIFLVCLKKYHLKCVSIDPMEREEIDNKKTTWYCRECLKAILPFNP